MFQMAHSLIALDNLFSNKRIEIVHYDIRFTGSIGSFLLDLIDPNAAMKDYFKELKQAQNHFHNKFYPTSISECGRIIEVGLKQLYTDLESHLRQQESELSFEKMKTEFEVAKGVSFEFDKATLGSMLLFTRHTDFWNQLKNMCESNLSFLRMVNWGRVRYLRNHSTHSSEVMGKSDALEMLFYTKVFLYDCGLIQGMEHAAPEILDAHCMYCDFKINQDWRFCPSCGTNVQQNCENCGRNILSNHRICPHCDNVHLCKTDLKEAVQTYKRYAEAVWADWEVTPMERKWLLSKRLELGISPEEAEMVETSVIPKHYYHFLNLVDATNIDGIIDDDEVLFLMDKAGNLGISEDAANKIIRSSRNESKKIQKKFLNLKFL
jgi:hypothetical protein